MTFTNRYMKMYKRQRGGNYLFYCNPTGSNGILSNLSTHPIKVDDIDFPTVGHYYIYRKGTSIVSAATTNIWASVGDFIHITGTNTISSFSSAPYAGSERTVVADGAFFINTSAAITIPGGNVTTAVNDSFVIRADTVSTTILTQYQRSAIGPPI